VLREAEPQESASFRRSQSRKGNAIPIQIVVTAAKMINCVQYILLRGEKIIFINVLEFCSFKTCGLLYCVSHGYEPKPELGLRKYSPFSLKA
jgi:hypothetical protein